MLHDILRRALVLLNIALEQRLSAELRSEIEQVDQNENGQSRRHGKPPSDIALVLHRDRLIDSDLQSNEKLSRFLCRTPLRAEIYRAAGPRPAPRFRIPDSGFRTSHHRRPVVSARAPPSRMPDPGESSAPPAPPDCNRAAAVLHEKRAHDNGVRSATSYARTAEPVRRDETACRRSEPLAAARFRALHSTPGRPHRDSARLDASGIMRTSTVSKHAKPPPAAPDIRPSTAKASANGRSAVRFHGNDSAPAAPTRQGQDRTRPRRTRPKRSFLPVPGSRERHFPYTSPRPAFSVFFISEMIVIGPTPPGNRRYVTALREPPRRT